MKIKSIELINFRNHKKKKFEFSDSSTFISGNNGAGKTNILEAIYMLSIGKSFRAFTEKEVVNMDSNFSRIMGIFDDEVTLDIGMEKMPTGRLKKTFKKNGVVKMSKNFVGIFKSVLFNPEDIRLVIGSPSRRREYLDSFLSQIYRDYYKSKNKYERILKHRNKLLSLSQGQVMHNIFESQLEVWDRQLIESGVFIQDFRRMFFSFANEVLKDISKELYGDDFSLGLVFLPNIINENTLNNARNRDLLIGNTSVGPHRDDFEFILHKSGHKFDLKSYGSRGQQRTAALCLKILELEYIERETKERPTLLLDDIFSELDDNFRENITMVMKKYQTVVTSAEHIEEVFNRVIHL